MTTETTKENQTNQTNQTNYGLVLAELHDIKPKGKKLPPYVMRDRFLVDRTNGSINYAGQNNEWMKVGEYYPEKECYIVNVFDIGVIKFITVENISHFLDKFFQESCQNKVRYKTKEHGLNNLEYSKFRNIMNSNTEAQDARACHVYYCYFCQGYHTGHKKSQWTNKDNITKFNQNFCKYHRIKQPVIQPVITTMTTPIIEKINNQTYLVNDKIYDILKEMRANGKVQAVITETPEPITKIIQNYKNIIKKDRSDLRNQKEKVRQEVEKMFESIIHDFKKGHIDSIVGYTWYQIVH